MFTAFSTMIVQAFSMLTYLFSGGERFAKAFDSLGKVAEKTAEAYADEAEIKQAAQLSKLKAELKAVELSNKQLPNKAA